MVDLSSPLKLLIPYMLSATEWLTVYTTSLLRFKTSPAGQTVDKSKMVDSPHYLALPSSFREISNAIGVRVGVTPKLAPT